MCLFTVILILFALSFLMLCNFLRGKPSNLSHDLILITGAAHGIGRLLALELSKLCKNVIAIDKDSLGLTETKDLVQSQNGVSLICYNCDLSDPNAIKECADDIRAKYGRVTLLISNAGIVNGNYLLDIPTEKVDKIMKVNFMASLLLIKEFLPGMLGSAYKETLERIPTKLRVESEESISSKCFPEAEPRGHLVFMSSIASQIPSVGLSDYCASKAAISGLVDSLRLELDKLGMSDKITLTDIRPFAINTDMFEGFKSKLPVLPILKSDQVVKRVVEAIRYRRRVVYIPRIIWLLPILQRILPQCILVSLYRVSGAMDQMDEFERSNKKHE